MLSTHAESYEFLACVPVLYFNRKIDLSDFRKYFSTTATRESEQT